MTTLYKLLRSTYRALTIMLVFSSGCGTVPTSSEQMAPISQSVIPTENIPSPPVEVSLPSEDQDQDGDGLTLAEELAYGTSDSSTDTDFDGLTDFEEITVFATDPTNPDSDSDGWSDFDEVMVLGTDPLFTDSDLDGLSDDEELRFETNPSLADTDGDGLTDFEEIYTYVTNPRFWDTDFDLISDYDEVHVVGSSPLLIDSDFDGLTDWRELAYGTDPNLIDTDGDGLSDLDEINALTDPLDVNDPPPFVAGNLFSFLAAEETDILNQLANEATRQAARSYATCHGEIQLDLARRGILNSGVSAGYYCGCSMVAAQLAVEGFEEALFDVLDRVGYTMTSADRSEVSVYMHSQYDTSSACRPLSCIQFSTLCAG